MKKTLLIIFLLIYNLSGDSNNTIPQIGIYEHLGNYIPIDLILTDDSGKSATIKEFMQNKPTIFSFNYYTCPGICSPQLAGMAKVIDNMTLRPGKDYNVLTVSINEKDTVQKAAVKKAAFLNLIKKQDKAQIAKTWKFMVASKSDIKSLTDKIGFKFEKRTKNGIIDFIHPGALIVVSADGKIARYLNGLTYLPFDLKLAVSEASKGLTGPTISKTLLLCFAYDPKARTYVFQAEKIVGIIITLLMIIFFIYLVRTGRKNK